jgi:hypothetical protein
MLGKFIAGDFIAIAGEMRRFPASNENTAKSVQNNHNSWNHMNKSKSGLPVTFYLD